MKITVLNGSPKGDISITMQYINYIKKRTPEHEFEIINVGQKIKKLQKDSDFFDTVMETIKSSDGIIWASPVYVLSVPSNYHRFIELIYERNATDAFAGKYAVSLNTSLHFYDNTAINYLNSICDDLQMKYVDFLSLDMDDIEKEDRRKLLMKFATNFFNAIENNLLTTRKFDPLRPHTIKYLPEDKPKRMINTSNKKILVITDSLENDNVVHMIAQFRNSFTQEVELVNLQDLDIKGSCIGCIQCAYDHTCFYKDDYRDFYNNTVKQADIIVFAGAIHNRYLSSTWKLFLDRAFFNNHTPTLLDKHMGYIISGPLKQMPNLQEQIEAYTQIQHAHLDAIVTDEHESNEDIHNHIYRFASTLIEKDKSNYEKPFTFLGVAAWKIFADEIKDRLRFPFVADYRAYKRLNLFTTPTSLKSRIFAVKLMTLCGIPAIRNKIYTNDLKNRIIEPMQEIVENLDL